MSFFNHTASRLQLALVIVSIASLLGLAGAQDLFFGNGAGAVAGRASVVYPPQEIPLLFDHTAHLERGATCTDCHQRVQSSRSALDNNLPSEMACRGCHAIDRKSGEGCQLCHDGYTPEMQGLVRRASLPVGALKFSHQAHLDRQLSCTSCHGDLVASKVKKAGLAQLPAMSLCLECHDGQKAQDACATCHLTQAGGVLQTEFPGLGQLVPVASSDIAAHDLNFRSSHKYAAQNNSEYCESCHKKDECTECHAGVVKPMDFHVGDYIRLHPIEARRNSPDCSSCHRLQTFCQGCHSRMGVADDNKGSAFAEGGAYHPPGWVESGLLGRGPNHHSYAAQRNIKQCASCHRESFCTQCHSAEPGGRMQVSPHPRGWATSRRCRSLASRNPRVCLRCHVEGEGADCTPR